MADFSQASLEELNNLNPEDVGSLKEEEFLSYHRRSLELGNKYMINGIQDEYTSAASGTTAKNLRFNDQEKKWEVTAGFGLLPKFKVNPLMVDEKRFKREMESKGVPKDLVDEIVKRPPKDS